MEYGVSIFPVQPNDPNAYVFTEREFGADPSGDRAQAVIDKLESEVKNGIIFVSEVTYRLRVQ